MVPGACGAKGAGPVQDGGCDREAVLQQGGPGGVDAGAQGGQGPAGVAGGHQVREPGGFDELDGRDLAVGQPDGGDLLIVPGPAVVDVQDLAGEAHGGGRVEAVGADPVHGEPSVDGRSDAEFLAHFPPGALRGGLVLIDAAAGQEAGRAVVDVLDQDAAAFVCDQHGRSHP